MSHYEVIKTKNEPFRKPQCRRVLDWRCCLSGGLCVVCSPKTHLFLSFDWCGCKGSLGMEGVHCFYRTLTLMPSRAPRLPLAGFSQAVWNPGTQLLFSTLHRQGLCQTPDLLIKVALALLVMMQTPRKPESLNERTRERVSEQTAVEHCICAKLCAWHLSSLRTRHVIQWHFFVWEWFISF